MAFIEACIKTLLVKSGGHEKSIFNIWTYLASNLPISTWTFLNLKVDKNIHFWTKYPSHPSTYFLKKSSPFKRFNSDVGFSFPISSMIVFLLKDTRLPHATLAGQQAAGIYFSFTILHTYFVVYLLYKIQLQYFCYIVTLSYTLRIKATLQVSICFI